MTSLSIVGEITKSYRFIHLGNDLSFIPIKCINAVLDINALTRRADRIQSEGDILISIQTIYGRPVTEEGTISVSEMRVGFRHCDSKR